MKLNQLLEDDLPSLRSVAFKLLRALNELDHIKNVEFIDEWVLHVTTNNDFVFTVKVEYFEHKTTDVIGIFEYEGQHLYKLPLNYQIKFNQSHLLAIINKALMYEFRQKFPTSDIQSYALFHQDEYQVSLKSSAVRGSTYFQYCEQALSTVGISATELSYNQFNFYIQTDECFTLDWQKLQQMKVIQ